MFAPVYLDHNATTPLDPAVEGVSGRYFVRGRPSPAQRWTMASMLDPRPEIRMTMRWVMAGDVQRGPVYGLGAARSVARAVRLAPW